MNRPTDHFRYRGADLTCDRVALDGLARRFGTPLYVYSGDAFVESLQKLRASLRGLDPLVCFAVKSCSNLSILKKLGAQGAGMDVVSVGELERALRAGVDPRRVVFSGVGKTEPEIVRALKIGIHSFNVESAAELATIDRLAKKSRCRADVALRFNPDVDAHTHPHISTGLKKNKFGLVQREIIDLARRHREFAAIRIAGLSIHIGSQIRALSSFDDAFKKTRSLAERLDAILPAPLSFVDLGGGLGIAYGAKEKPPSVAAYGALVKRHFGDLAYRILLEPGRAISGNAGVLVAEVVGKKTRAGKTFLVLDAGMNDLIRPALYGSEHQILPLKRVGSLKTARMDVVGPVCETSDCFAAQIRLPAALKAGDRVAILSAGAYGMSMASQYNTRGRAAEILVEGTRSRLIRKRETLADLLKLELEVLK